jgi:integrase
VKALNKRDTALYAEEMRRLLDAADDVVDDRLAPGDDDGLKAKLLRAFILAQYDSMLRPEEARGLRLERIQADGAVELQARSTKSKRNRSVVLTERTLEAIREIHGASKLGPVFAWADGSQVSRSALYDWFIKARNIAGIQAAPGDRHVQQRDLRASGATEADRRGARAVAIRDCLGHSDLTITQRYLRTSLAENARHVAEVMGDQDNSRRSPRRAPSKSSLPRKKQARTS